MTTLIQMTTFNESLIIQKYQNHNNSLNELGHLNLEYPDFNGKADFLPLIHCDISNRNPVTVL